MTRQKFVGWVLVVVSAAYLAYFLKVRLFTPGPFVAKREWLQVVGSIVSLMLGVMNVRLAARSHNRRSGPLSNRQS